MYTVESRIKNNIFRNNGDILISSVAGFLLLTIMFLYFEFSPIYCIAIIVVSFMLLFIFNIKIIYSILIISFFKTILIFELYYSLYIIPFLAISYILSRSKINFEDLKIPIVPFLLLYLLSMFPSFINTVSIVGSLLKMLNYAAFLLTIFLTILIFRESRETIKYIYLYLFMVFLNSIHVILLADTGKRLFGFAGIMFVDYVSLGLIISLMLFFYSAKLLKIFYLSLSIILAIAMILTQTRGVWVAFAASFAITLLVLYIKGEKLFINRKNIIMLSSLFFILGAMSLMRSSDLSTAAANRVENIGEVDEKAMASGEVNNSLITRLFIWHTSYNAFMQHPFVGIGAYSFPFSSQHYYTIPKLFYKRYVEKLTPHETFIAILAETGITGFIGFCLLLLAILKLNIANLKHSNNFEDAKYSIIFLSANLYIICSMVITDAWLWGHGIVLWGVILGMTAVHYKSLIDMKNIKY